MCNFKHIKKAITAMAMLLITLSHYGQNNAQPLKTFLGT